jgi:hypothetical protein
MTEALTALSSRGAQSDVAAIVSAAIDLKQPITRVDLGTIVSRPAIRLPPALHYRFHTWGERAFAQHAKAHLIRVVNNG